MKILRPINEECFKDSFYAEDANRGMSFVRKIHLPTYQRYYRFSSYSVRKEERVSSPWWFEYENYLRIVDFAEQNELSPGYAVRLKAGITYDWSRVNCLVSAVLRAPLYAYGGKGRAQTETDQREPGRIYLPDSQIMQLYIPGLRDERTKNISAICRQAFPVYKFEHLVSRFFR